MLNKSFIVQVVSTKKNISKYEKNAKLKELGWFLRNKFIHTYSTNHTHFWLELAFSSFLIKNNEYMICCSLYFIQLKKDKQCIMIKVNKYCKYTAKSLQSFHFCQTERKKKFSIIICIT